MFGSLKIILDPNNNMIIYRFIEQVVVGLLMMVCMASSVFFATHVCIYLL